MSPRGPSAGPYRVARAHYEDALPLQRELGDARGEANSLNNLGRVLFAEGKLLEAGQMYEA